MKTKMNIMKSSILNHLCLVCTLMILARVGSSTARADDQTFQSYSARGVVEKIAPDQRQVTIHHQDIPGYMMEMTMDFPVQDTNELNGISVGDKITFTLVVGQTNDWVENIHRVGHTDVAMSNSMPMTGGMSSKLKPGDMLPDGELVTEDGNTVHFSNFRGTAVAFTFFFTRCPLPNYCPLMNRNFEQARVLLLSQPDAPTNWEFLSISFDPQFDTPEVLSDYAGAYRGTNADHWLFADATTNTLAHLAPRLGLMVMRQGNNISHNLRTVVIDPQGRIYKQFNGNQWTPQQLAEALTQAALLSPMKSMSAMP
ncbi:MAG TPA: copper-binding protein [Candidatus Saccharimonadales bacterium]|nr:copper-binding protein [Candidatus Saccharimonadales bacterium]